MIRHATSFATREALNLLALQIRAGRIRRGWTAGELAERLGVARSTVHRIERGESGTAVGTMFEAATLVGVPLFGEDREARERYGAHKRAELELLPDAVRPRREVDDDF